MTAPSLKWRLSIQIVVVLIVAVTIVGAVALDELHDSLVRGIDRTLQVMADGAIEALDEPLTEQELKARLRFVTGGARYDAFTKHRAWVDSDGTVTTPSRLSDAWRDDWDFQPRPEWRPAMGQARLFDLRLAGARYRAIWTRRPTHRGNVNVVIAHASGITYWDTREVFGVVLIVGCCVIVSSLIATAIIVSRGLRPIAQTAESLQSITHRNLGRASLQQLRTPRELQPFVTATDNMLKRLESFIDMQRRFAADASHELRTPLAVVKSTLQTVTMGKPTVEDCRQAMDEALDDLDRMERLIDQLLVQARLDGLDVSGEGEPVPLAELLHTLRRLFEPIALRSGNPIVWPAPPAAVVKGDETLLTRLFTNLLQNAIEHGPAAGRIQVAVARDSDTSCVVTVWDEGGHVSSEALPHVFERFYRADSSRHRNTGGSGLGLAIARDIAVRHGGSIDMTSSAKEGTCVTVQLPCEWRTSPA